MRGGRRPDLVFTMGAASALTTLGAIPVFLLGSQSVFVRRDLNLNEAQFGLAVSCFFTSAAIAALLGGGLVDRLGRRRSTVVAGGVAAVGGAGLAWGVRSYALLAAALVVLGVANAALQVTSNLSLATSVPVSRQGLAFGVKQSATPLAIFLGGLAVPAVGASVGWRWTFGITAALALLVVLGGLRLPRDGAVRNRRHGPVEKAPAPALAVTFAAMTLAAAALTSFGVFLAEWGFQVGMTPSQAGYLMAAGSGLAILARILTGHLADRRGGRNLPVVAGQMLVGALALSVVSLDTVLTLWPATILVFAVGWAWPGLLLFAVVRFSRDAPAAASAAVQAGAFVGGAAGPALFGFVVIHTDYPFAWRLTAGCLLAAAGLVLVARRLFLRDLRARPIVARGPVEQPNGHRAETGQPESVG